MDLKLDLCWVFMTFQKTGKGSDRICLLFNPLHLLLKLNCTFRFHLGWQVTGHHLIFEKPWD